MAEQLKDAKRAANDRTKKFLGVVADTYAFVENKEKTKTECIGIKGGKYDGVVYRYGKVAAVEDQNKIGLEATLKFQYNIVDYNGLTEEHIGEDFKNLIGDILCDIVDSHYTYKQKEQNESGKSDDRKDDPKSTDT